MGPSVFPKHCSTNETFVLYQDLKDYTSQLPYHLSQLVKTRDTPDFTIYLIFYFEGISAAAIYFSQYCT